MILSLITEVAQEVIDEMKSDKEEERMVVVATYNEDEDVEETDTESVFVIPKGVDLEDADEVEEWYIYCDTMTIAYTDGRVDYIKPLIAQSHWGQYPSTKDISIMWKKTWCDAFFRKEKCADCDITLDEDCHIMRWYHREEEKTFCRECWEDKHWISDDNVDNEEKKEQKKGEEYKKLKYPKRCHWDTSRERRGWVQYLGAGHCCLAERN